MYKMIIIDDEPLTRQGIKSSVNWNLMDIEIIGEATNGLEAMLMIHETSPDIAICDIKMPKIDGISLINEVHRSHPNMQVLFISGYSDKEYLKNAIKLNAVDYLFKPFQLHELIEAVEKAKNNCMKFSNSNIKNNDLDVALELLRITPEEIKDFDFSEYPIDPYKIMISIVIKFQVNDTLNYSQGHSFDSKIMVRHYQNIFRDAASNVFKGKFIMSCVDTGYIIHANIDNVNTSNSIDISFANAFLTLIDPNTHGVCVGVGLPCKSFIDIRKSFIQAREASSASFLLGLGKVIFYNDLNDTSFEPDSNLQKKFYDNILNDNFGCAIEYLNEYVDYMCHCKVEDIPLIKDELASIAFWINEHIANFENKSKGYVTDMINYASNIQNIKSFLLSQIDKYIENVSNMDNKGRILLEAEQYIIRNYDKPLTIKEIAEQVYITPNYLCYLYKKNTKKTINQFILDVKMDKAKHFLRFNSNMKISDISDALGYANQNYFTRTFTKYTGISPRTYRNKYVPPNTFEEE